MATTNITQLHRVVIRKRATAEADWSTFTLEPDDLGQDTVATVNVAPRLKSRASSVGTTETPISGTFDALAGSITFLADTWKIIGEALGRWNAATYEGAGANAGNMSFGGSNNLCDDGQYVSVIVQGICDDGSTADVEICRCMPSIDDDIEIGSSDAQEITLNLHPIIYNPTYHLNDGYTQETVHFGDASLTQKQRLNATTGVYDAVTESE